MSLVIIYHPDGFLLWKQSPGLSKRPLTAYVFDSSCCVPHISVEALATDVNAFANKGRGVDHANRPTRSAVRFNEITSNVTCPSRVHLSCMCPVTRET